MKKDNYKFGLIGFPLEHSLSPIIHRAALKTCNLSGDYLLFSVPDLPDGKDRLAAIIRRIELGEIDGVNVTIPHKENILPYVKNISPEGRSVRAANIVYIRGDGLFADNTDIGGFKRHLQSSGYSYLFGRKYEKISEFGPWALVLGAGGSARAVLYSLLQDGWNCFVCARRVAQAEAIREEYSLLQFGGEIRVIPYNRDAISGVISRIRLIVNTTPLGMSPNIDQNPWPNSLALPEKSFVYDLVYNPYRTRLIRQAQAEGIGFASGIGMLIEQAALAFELWTGCTAPRDIMRVTALEHLGDQ